MWSIKFCLYGFLVLSAATAVLALNTSGFVYKSATAGIGALIILLLQFQRLKPPKAVWLVFVNHERRQRFVYQGYCIVFHCSLGLFMVCSTEW